MLVTNTVSAVEMPLSLTFSVFEPAPPSMDSVPASPARLPVFVGALLETLTVSSPPPVLMLYGSPLWVLWIFSVSLPEPVVKLMPPPNVPLVAW